MHICIVRASDLVFNKPSYILLAPARALRGSEPHGRIIQSIVSYKLSTGTAVVVAHPHINWLGLGLGLGLGLELGLGLRLGLGLGLDARSRTALA